MSTAFSIAHKKSPFQHKILRRSARRGKTLRMQSDLDASEQTLSTVIIVFAVILGVVAVVSVVGLVPALRKGKK